MILLFVASVAVSTLELHNAFFLHFACHAQIHALKSTRLGLRLCISRRENRDRRPSVFTWGIPAILSFQFCVQPKATAKQTLTNRNHTNIQTNNASYISESPSLNPRPSKDNRTPGFVAVATKTLDVIHRINRNKQIGAASSPFVFSSFAGLCADGTREVARCHAFEWLARGYESTPSHPYALRQPVLLNENLKRRVQRINRYISESHIVHIYEVVPRVANTGGPPQPAPSPCSGETNGGGHQDPHARQNVILVPFASN